MPRTPRRAGESTRRQARGAGTRGLRSLGALVLAGCALPLAILTGCALPLAMLGGCAPAATTSPSPSPAARTVWGTAPAIPTASRRAASAPTAAIEAVTAVEAGSASRLGLSMAPLGATPVPWTAGTLAGGPAWSTIKVPIVLADLRAGRAEISEPTVRAAITESDNAAAATLTRRLGTDRQAAAAIGAELSRYHDSRTRPATRSDRPGFSVLGQTGWALADQTTFMASLACDRAQAPMLSLMGQIADGQRWGLGTLAGARFKGGWGPDAEGRYLVRQTGVITVGRSSFAVSMAAVAGNGQFATGTRALDRLAARLPAVAAAMPAGSCPASGS